MERQVAIVTGASRGIGQAIARKLHHAGMIVVLSSRSGPALQAMAEEMSQSGHPALACEADVRREEDVQRMVGLTTERFGRLDVLINNAGVIRDRLLLGTTEEDWAHVMDTNLKGPFLCIKAAAREMMLRKYGRIINISSIAAHGGGPGQAAYSAAKSGLEGLTRVAALELAAKGITVNAIAPGIINTEMTQEYLEGETVKQIPLRRVGLPEDIAGMALFLASAEAGYLTGQVIQVAGGLGLTYKRASR